MPFLLHLGCGKKNVFLFSFYAKLFRALRDCVINKNFARIFMQKLRIKIFKLFILSRIFACFMHFKVI